MEMYTTKIYAMSRFHYVNDHIIYLSIYLYIYLSIYLSISVCLYLYICMCGYVGAGRSLGGRALSCKDLDPPA